MKPVMPFAAIIAIAAASPAMGQAALPPTSTEMTLLDIVVEGQVQRTPDLATIRAGIVTQAASAADALRQNSSQMAAVIAELRRAGVAERDVATASVSLSPQYRYADGQPPVITGYQASNQLTIRFREVDRAGPILDALVARGVNQIEGPTLGLAKAEEALDAARADAVKRATERAQLYATAAGLQVDRILSIQEAGAMPPPQPMPAYVRMDMAAAAPESKILPGEQDVSVTLTVRFRLR